jgi:hypothetical protein
MGGLGVTTAGQRANDGASGSVDGTHVGARSPAVPPMLGRGLLTVPGTSTEGLLWGSSGDLRSLRGAGSGDPASTRDRAPTWVRRPQPNADPRHRSDAGCHGVPRKGSKGSQGVTKVSFGRDTLKSGQLPGIRRRVSKGSGRVQKVHRRSQGFKTTPPFRGTFRPPGSPRRASEPLVQISPRSAAEPPRRSAPETACFGAVGFISLPGYAGTVRRGRSLLAIPADAAR